MPSGRKSKRALVVSAAMAIGAGAAFVGWGDLLFLALAVALVGVTLLWLRRVVAPTPTLVLSPSGVQVRDVAFITWDNLERLEVFRMNARFLAFHVFDPHVVPLRLPWWKRVWQGVNQGVEGATASVTENMVGGRFEDLVPTILRYKVVPVVWRG